MVLLAKQDTPVFPPRIDLRAEGVNRTQLPMQMTMHGHALSFFPALDGAHVTLEIGGDLLPRLEPGGRSSLRSRYVFSSGTTHGVRPHCSPVRLFLICDL